MSRFIKDGIEVPAIPKLYLWPDGGWRPEEPEEETFAEPWHAGVYDVVRHYGMSADANGLAWRAASAAIDIERSNDPAPKAEPEEDSWGEIDRHMALAFVPYAAKDLPRAALDAATEGAGMLDALAFTKYGRNFLAHALAYLAAGDWLKDDGRPTPPKQPEAEEQCGHCGYDSNAHALGCTVLTGNAVYHPGIVMQGSQPEKSLKDKIEALTSDRYFTVAAYLDVFREHFDSKFDDIADWLGKYAQQAITTGVIDNNEAHGDLRAILFGEHA